MESPYYQLALLFFIFLIIKKLSYRKQNLPPSPFALPVIGHLHLLKKPIHASLQALLSQYGPIIFLKLGSRPVLVVSSPSAVEECFTKNDIIFANRPQSMAGDYLSYNYTSLAWAPYGHLWRCVRRFSVVQILSSKSIQRSSAIREEEVGRVLGRLLKMSSGSAQEVELKSVFSILAANVVMRVTTGERFVEEVDAGTEMEKQLVKEFKELFSPQLPMMNICDFIPILTLIGFGGIKKDIIKLQRNRDEYLQKWVDKIRLKGITSLNNAKLSDEGGKKSVIEMLFTLQESDPEFYTDEVIKSILLVLFVAGIETSAVTLEWAMTCLLNHPEALQKLKAEIDNQVGHGHLLNDLDVAKLPYLRCVVNETLRLYPPAPLLLPHLSSETCYVGGYEIPQGTTLMVNAWAMHRDPKVWEEPDKFIPERFEAGLWERGGFKFVPFGMGRRACPGSSMGLQIVSLALGAFIQCFEWNKVQLEEDMSATFGASSSKAKPLEALCSPRPNLIKLLSNL